MSFRASAALNAIERNSERTAIFARQPGGSASNLSTGSGLAPGSTSHQSGRTEAVVSSLLKAKSRPVKSSQQEDRKAGRCTADLISFRKLSELRDSSLPSAPLERRLSINSIEACLREGIDPEDLRYQTLEDFMPTGGPRGRRALELQKLRWEAHETRRQERLLKLQLVRDGVVRETRAADGANKENINKENSSQNDKNVSTMLERERRRLVVLERRQRRELEQVIRAEQRRIQLAEDAEEKALRTVMREKEEEKARQMRSLEWKEARKKQNEERRQKELEKEALARRAAQEYYEQERRQAEKEAAQEKERRRRLREEDRMLAQKREMFKLQMQAAAEAAAKELEYKQNEISARDAERQAHLALLNKERVHENMQRRRRAERRINAALAASRQIREKRMEIYERKQEQAVIQYEAMKQMKAERDAARQAEAARKAVRRMKILEEAQREEARQVEVLLERQKKHDRTTLLAQKRREHEARVRRLQASMTAQERTEKAAAIGRVRAYERMKLQSKLEAGEARVDQLLAERRALQSQRADVARQSLTARAKMATLVERINTTGTMPSTRPRSADAMLRQSSV